VYSEHPFVLALEPMGASGCDVLPSLSRTNRRRLIGLITLESILKSYGITMRVQVQGESQP
jgi:hypothetical protein